MLLNTDNRTLKFNNIFKVCARVYKMDNVLNLSVPGGVETRYSCCQGTMGAPGCQVFKVKKNERLQLLNLPKYVFFNIFLS